MSAWRRLFISLVVLIGEVSAQQVYLCRDKVGGLSSYQDTPCATGNGGTTGIQAVPGKRQSIGIQAVPENYESTPPHTAGTQADRTDALADRMRAERLQSEAEARGEGPGRRYESPEVMRLKKLAYSQDIGHNGAMRQLLEMMRNGTATLPTEGDAQLTQLKKLAYSREIGHNGAMDALLEMQRIAAGLPSKALDDQARNKAARARISSYQTRDINGVLVNSQDDYLTRTSGGAVVSSRDEHLTKSAFGATVSSTSCYTTKDAFGALVNSPGCTK